MRTLIRKVKLALFVVACIWSFISGMIFLTHLFIGSGKSYVDGHKSPKICAEVLLVTRINYIFFPSVIGCRINYWLTEKVK